MHRRSPSAWRSSQSIFRDRDRLCLLAFWSWAVNQVAAHPAIEDYCRTCCSHRRTARPDHRNSGRPTVADQQRRWQWSFGVWHARMSLGSRLNAVRASPQALLVTAAASTLILQERWCCRTGLNCRPLPYQGREDRWFPALFPRRLPGIPEPEPPRSASLRLTNPDRNLGLSDRSADNPLLGEQGFVDQEKSVRRHVLVSQELEHSLVVV